MSNYYFYKEWQIMQDLQLELVTLHERFTIGIDEDKENMRL